MIQKQFLVVALGAGSFALAACDATMTGNEGGSGGPGPTAGTSTGATGMSGSSGVTGTGGGGTAGTSPGTGGTGGTSGVGGTAGNPTCVAGVPTTTQFRRLMNRQYDAAVRDLLGVTGVGASNALPSSLLFADFDGPMNADAWRIYQEVGSQIAAQVMAGASRTRFIGCDPATAGCLTQTIQTFGRKAFRRPLTTEEVTHFEKLSMTTPAGTPAQVAETTLFAFLVSPSFLQLTELNAEAEGTAIKLSSYEVAARLSFLLWDSVPDDILSAAADANELTTKEQILAQAQRMIMVREKTGPLVAGFHRHWLQMDNSLSHWWKVQHDTAKFPLYSVAAVPSYAAELDKFFEEVAFANGSFKDLFLSSVGFVNRDNAAIYGLDPAAYGADLVRVDLNQDQRPGFLTRVGFLQSYSHFDGTAPILRGAFITVNMIGADPGPPDPTATQTPPPPGPFATEREMVETLTGVEPCTGCHTPYVNPPGFVLEHYDSIGKWQDTDARGGPINGTATITLADGTEKAIASPRELMQEIGQGPVARHGYAQQWVSYTTGRPANANDACTVDTLDMKLSQDGYTVLNLLADLTQADSFRLRVREN